ncbi:MAG TPA: hypothetical protein VFN10_14185 [Thermoanaerobaculia bacterium]|nr:hypothetical protein [Thermoanaerobaculia bacterium]
MSKRNNVNPNFYQTAGREHTDGPDRAVVHEEQDSALAETEKKTKRNFIPGAAPVGETSKKK